MKLHYKIFRQNGFTLAEMLIVMTVIAILAMLTIPTVIMTNKERTFADMLNQTYQKVEMALILDKVLDFDISNYTISAITKDYTPKEFSDLLKKKLKIINYCDFYMSWNWEAFKKQLVERNPDGCVPCYTGFHPHLMVPKNFYASCLTDEDDNLIEIREKYSFEADKTKAKHSPGNYYFKNGAYLKKYCQALVDSGEVLNGEYYASMPYNFMVKDGLTVWVPTNIDYFCQWGTPEDMKESVYWINLMKEMKR